MSHDELIVEKVWTHPDPSTARSICFLERFDIYIQIRNNTSRPLQVEKIECLFELDDEMDKYLPSTMPFLTLGPKQRNRMIRIVCEADLSLKAHTNFFRVRIHYTSDSKKIIEYDPHKFLVFVPLGEEDKQFFISHKDKEDTDISRLLAKLLRKLGYKGYLAEDDKRPGMNLWKEKIPSEIKCSAGFIILWTKNATKNPKNIYRELEIAKKMNKHLILAREDGVDIPKDFPKEIEYFNLESPILAHQLKELVYSIEETDSQRSIKS